MLAFKKVPPFNVSANRQMRELIRRIKKTKLGLISYCSADLKAWYKQIKQAAQHSNIDISHIGTNAVRVEKLMKQYFLSSDFYAGDALNQMAKLEHKEDLTFKDKYVYFYSPELRKFFELGNDYDEIMLSLVMLLNRVADMKLSWIFYPAKTSITDVMQHIIHLNEINNPQIRTVDKLDWKLNILENQYVWQAHGTVEEKYERLPSHYAAKALSVRNFLESQPERFTFYRGKAFKNLIPEINEDATYLMDNGSQTLKFIGTLTDSDQKWLAHFTNAINHFVEEKDNGYYYYYGIFYDQLYSLLEVGKKEALEKIKRLNSSNETGRGFGGMVRGPEDEETASQQAQDTKVELTANTIGKVKLSLRSRNQLTILLGQVKNLPVIAVKYQGENDLSTLTADQVDAEMFVSTRGTLGEYINGKQKRTQEAGLWTGYDLNDFLKEKRRTANDSQDWMWYSVNDEAQLYLFNEEIYQAFPLGTTLAEVKHQLRQHFTNSLTDSAVKKTAYCYFLAEDITEMDAVQELVARNRAKKQRDYQLGAEFEWPSESTIHIQDPSYGHFLELNQADIKLLAISPENTEITVSLDPIAHTLTCYFPNYEGKIKFDFFTEDARKRLAKYGFRASDYAKTRTVSFNTRLKLGLADLVALGIENPLAHIGQRYAIHRYYDFDGGRIIFEQFIL